MLEPNRINEAAPRASFCSRQSLDRTFMRFVFALTVFLAAFLLFQVQPLMGRLMLPWFGGSAGVWVNAVLFFQIALLLGYGYAHLVSTKLSPQQQIVVHAILLLAAMFFLPFLPATDWAPAPGESPALGVFMVLLSTVGLPFIALSSTSPLLQSWYARNPSRSSPYRLYAVSNAGSLLALLSYPFLMEVYFSLKVQSWIWAVVFGFFAILTALIAWQFVFGGEGVKTSMIARGELDAERPGKKESLLWLTLSATGSVLLLATINEITQDLPPVPFLFILPLAIYLLTFIATFDHPRWYMRKLFIGLLPIAIASAIYANMVRVHLSMPAHLGALSFALLVCLMCCHGELARRKPAVSYLTHFYLVIALGGALGGFFVALIAPMIFANIREYEISLVASYVLVLVLVGKELLARIEASENSGGRVVRASGVQLPVTTATAQTFLTAGSMGLLLLLVAVAVFWFSGKDFIIAQERNFYGVTTVIELYKNDPRFHQYRLNHGATVHGFQFRLPEKRSWKTSYYGDTSGMGLAINRHPERNDPTREFKIGAIGLGAGVAAAYAGWVRTKAGTVSLHPDVIRFYEINPLVRQYADQYFSFLEDARQRGVKLNVELGDARILMERELERGEAQHYDVLVVDAFSGDSVPIHLLTVEAFAIYRQHLARNGIIAFHLSNRYLDLIPVVSALAHSVGWSPVLIHSTRNNNGLDAAIWVLVTSNETFLADPWIKVAASVEGSGHDILWTDDFANLAAVLK